MAGVAHDFNNLLTAVWQPVAGVTAGRRPNRRLLVAVEQAATRADLTSKLGYARRNQRVSPVEPRRPGSRLPDPRTLDPVTEC